MTHAALRPEFAGLIDLRCAGPSSSATGFTFTEGPIWNPAGQFLLFSDMPADTRRRWDPEGRHPRGRAEPDNKGNGMTLDANGRLIVCEHTTSSLVDGPERPDGQREVLATHYGGQELNSPNDVCVRSDGSICFSDPWYGRMPVFGVERQRELGLQGVFRVGPAGGAPHACRRRRFEQPNGLCFSPDESLLYINDTPKALIRVYDVAGQLAFERPRLLRQHRHAIAEGIPDGMKCDEQGNIWVTGPGGVWVFSPAGELLGTVRIPENVGNLSWGGADWHTLFIPSSTLPVRRQDQGRAAHASPICSRRRYGD